MEENPYSPQLRQPEQDATSQKEWIYEGMIYSVRIESQDDRFGSRKGNEGQRVELLLDGLEFIVG